MDLPRLLVIDDEIDIAETVAEIAADRGFEVRSIFSADDLDDMLANFVPQAIVLDLMMPGTDGVELLRILAGKIKNVKIALMSGSDSRVLASAKKLGEAQGLAILAALEKPLDIVVLRQTLDALRGASFEPGSSQIAEAMQQGHIVPHYQPIVAVAERRVDGFEALARWQHPEKGLLAADDFIELAQRENQLAPLAHHILKQVARQIMHFKDAGQTPLVAVNVPLPALIAGDFPAFLDMLFTTHRLPPRSLALEISERDFQDPAVQACLPELQRIGAAIWLGDFGRTQLDLLKLMSHPASLFKLDRSLITNLPQDDTNQKLVAAVIGLCHGLQRPVSAIGVADEKTLSLLRQMGCDRVQGFAVAPALSAEQALIFKA